MFQAAISAVSGILGLPAHSAFGSSTTTRYHSVAAWQRTNGDFMEIAFRKLPTLESLAPQPGDIYLVPLTRKEADRRALASYVFVKGAAGLIRGEGPSQRIVVSSDAKLDDMLALTILQMELRGQL